MTPPRAVSIRLQPFFVPRGGGICLWSWGGQMVRWFNERQAGPKANHQKEDVLSSGRSTGNAGSAAILRGPQIPDA